MLLILYHSQACHVSHSMSWQHSGPTFISYVFCTLSIEFLGRGYMINDPRNVTIPLHLELSAFNLAL
jgi:hypothetical protein